MQNGGVAIIDVKHRLKSIVVTRMFNCVTNGINENWLMRILVEI